MNAIAYRPMTREDIPIVVELSRDFCEEIGREYDAETARQSYLDGFAAGGLLWVATLENKIVGVAAGRVFPTYMSRHELQCVEMVWHAERRLAPMTRGRIMVELLDILMRWSQNKGLPLVIGSGEPATQRLLKRRGFHVREVVYGR